MEAPQPRFSRPDTRPARICGAFLLRCRCGRLASTVAPSIAASTRSRRSLAPMVGRSILVEERRPAMISAPAPHKRSEALARSEWKCSAETRGREGWKKCSAETRFCEEDPGGQEGACLRLPNILRLDIPLTQGLPTCEVYFAGCTPRGYVCLANEFSSMIVGRAIALATLCFLGAAHSSALANDGLTFVLNTLICMTAAAGRSHRSRVAPRSHRRLISAPAWIKNNLSGDAFGGPLWCPKPWRIAWAVTQ